MTDDKLETPAEIHAALSIAEDGYRLEEGLLEHVAKAPTVTIDTTGVEPLPVSPDVEEAVLIHGKLDDMP